MKIAGTSKGKGFQGTIKRHNFASGPKSHGSHNVRAPGSIGASASPARVMKGIRGPGQMGNKRVTQKGLEIVRVDAKENLLLVRGSVPGPPGGDRGGAQRCLTPRARPAADAGAAKKVKLDDAAFGARFNGTARAPERARRAGRAPPRHGGDENARHGLRRRRQAVAPEGHRPRARRLQPLADLDGRRHRVRAPAALLHLQGQPQGAARRAAQRALAARRARLAGDPRRGRVRGAQDQPGASTCSTTGSRSPAHAPDARGARPRGVRRRAVLPQPRARRRAAAPRTSASPTCSAPPRCSSPSRPWRRSPRAPGKPRTGEEAKA